MTRSTNIVLLACLLVLIAIGAFVFFASDDGPDPFGVAPPDVAAESVDPLRAGRGSDSGSGDGDEQTRAIVVDPLARMTGVRGRVIDTRTGHGIGGVEVVALRRPPSIERLWSRFSGLFRRGLWTEANEAPKILGRGFSNADGSFEILGVEPGQLYLDGRSETVFVRTPTAVRVATGEIKNGVEVLASPGGRLRGIVLGPEGQPMPGAAVNLRPGLNAFLGQITQRKYRWFEVSAGDDGRFEIPGVPTGAGYTVSASHGDMALEELHGVDVAEGRTTDVTIRGHLGAEVSGRVVDAAGAPAAGVQVAMVYLDISRVLFSADGRDEPLSTAADGSFRISRVAVGRIALVAAGERTAPSQIEELTVVDGGIYDDVVLTLEQGTKLRGRVVDQADRPIAGAKIDARPTERPNDPDVLKMALKIRSLRAESGLGGEFELDGLTGSRVLMKVEKPGYATEVRFAVKPDEKDLVFRLVRGVTIRGRVVDSDGEPIKRFRIDTRSRDVAKVADASVDAEPSKDAPGTDASTSSEDGDRRGRGRRGRGGPPWARRGTMRIAEGQSIGERGMDGNWRDLKAADGRFVLTGVPPGKIRVRVEAEGYLRAEQEFELQGGATSEDLVFELKSGVSIAGTVVDQGGVPVPDAQVAASRSRSREGGGPFRINFEPADFDFLALMSRNGRNGGMTDSKGRFELSGLTPGKYRVSARHPDLAKASAKEIEVTAESPPRDLVIELTAGGGVEGIVTGAGRQPVRDALIVAASLSAGAFKSSSTDVRGHYAITGLPPGQYIVFKSRMDERAMNLGFDLLGNMRLKSVGVRAGRISKLDIYDAEEGTVRVFGRVTDAGKPVSRVMVTTLTTDRQGLLGMGIRAKPTDADGNYELIGLKPGDYVFQVTRFRGRPEQAGLSVEIPDEVTDFRFDIELPQSFIEGRVVDVAGNGLPGVRVSAGVVEGGLSNAGGILGLMMKNGLAQDRTDENGAFKLKSMAAGVYRVTASGRGRRGQPGDYGDAVVEDVSVDGRLPVSNLVLTLPKAGVIAGIVLDANGGPVTGAEINYTREDVQQRAQRGELEDLFGMQRRTEKSGADGRFEIKGVSPGTYSVNADIEGLAPGKADDVVVGPEQTVQLTLRVVKGATLRVRVTNIDGGKLPLARITLLDGKGKPVLRNMSVMSIFRRAMGGQEKKDDSGWRTFGDVPPDTYTVVITEKGQPDFRMSRTIKDGEKAEWDIDMVAELENMGRARKDPNDK